MSDEVLKDLVAVISTGQTEYPQFSPFHPSQEYLEYPFHGRGTDPDNYVYEAVRQLFFHLGFDRQNYGTSSWNPLGHIVQPGDMVIIKPNLVVSEHPLGTIGVHASVVHGSVIRPIVDYVLIANQGRGRIIIADSPIKEVDFDQVLKITGIQGILEFYNSIPGVCLETIDYRDLVVSVKDGVMYPSDLPGDPNGYVLIDLENESMLYEISHQAERLRSTASVYENTIPMQHNQRANIYSIPNTILSADAVISVAKMKTHRKAGVTLSLKNMVGITNEKRWLPHHRYGSPSKGGDMFPDSAPLDTKIGETLSDRIINNPYGRIVHRYGLPLLRGAYRTIFKWWIKRLIRSGNGIEKWGEGDWYGNDTVWRMVLDLNMILHYADRQGSMQQTRQRKYFSIIDSIVTGEGEGPLKPTVKKCGLLVGGSNPVAVDLTCTRLMGYDYKKIPIVFQALDMEKCPIGNTSPSRISIVSNEPYFCDIWRNGFKSLRFEPSNGWKGHIEED